MPTVVGLARDAAETTLLTADLKVGRVSTRWSDTVGEGVVLDAGQSPGASLKRDTAVALVVSGGPRPVEVTDWSGKDADDAVAALTRTGLEVTVTRAHSDEVDAGDVISQAPASGSVAKGTPVAVVESQGPVLVTVPNVKADGVRVAEKKLADAGFKTRTRRSGSYLGLGYVLSSSPAGGAQTPKGSTITLSLV